MFIGKTENWFFGGDWNKIACHDLIGKFLEATNGAIVKPCFVTIFYENRKGPIDFVVHGKGLIVEMHDVTIKEDFSSETLVFCCTDGNGKQENNTQMKCQYRSKQNHLICL